LVSRLQRYPRHSENTLTEALASALEAAPEIGRALLERYGGREVAGEIAVKTQIPAGRGFCDLELRSPPSGPVAVITWFEIKKDAPESGDDQLERYAAALAAEHPGVGTLVYLTRHGEPSNLEGVVDLSWIKLGELLREECQRLPAESYGRRLTEEFLRYLVEQGLTVIEPLSSKQSESLSDYDEAVDKLDYIFQAAFERLATRGWPRPGKEWDFQPVVRSRARRATPAWSVHSPAPHGYADFGDFDCLLDRYEVYADRQLAFGAGLVVRSDPGASSPFSDPDWSAKVQAEGFHHVDLGGTPRAYRFFALSDLAKAMTLEQQIDDLRRWADDAFTTLRAIGAPSRTE